MPRESANGYISTREVLEMKHAAEAALRKRGVSSERFIKKKKRTTRTALLMVMPLELAGTLEMLPAAKFLNSQGYRVFVRCPQPWHDIFECVNYAEPDVGFHQYDLVIDPSRMWKTATTAIKTQWAKRIYAKFTKYIGTQLPITFSRLPNPRIVADMFCWNGDLPNTVPLRYLPWIISHSQDIHVKPQYARETLLILDGLNKANKPNVRLFTNVNDRKINKTRRRVI